MTVLPLAVFFDDNDTYMPAGFKNSSNNPQRFTSCILIGNMIIETEHVMLPENKQLNTDWTFSYNPDVVFTKANAMNAAERFWAYINYEDDDFAWPSKLKMLAKSNTINSQVQLPHPDDSLPFPELYLDSNIHNIVNKTPKVLKDIPKPDFNKAVECLTLLGDPNASSKDIHTIAQTVFANSVLTGLILTHPSCAEETKVLIYLLNSKP